MTKRYTVLVISTLLVCFAALGQTNIDQLEYFIDKDPGAGSGTPISVNADISVSSVFTVPTAALSAGFHRLYVRARFADGRWGQMEEQAFYLLQPVANPTPDISAMEYFIDTDPGAGNGTPIAVNADVSVSSVFTVPTAALSAGFHRLYVRARFADGRWGQMEEQAFYLSQPYGLPRAIAAAEVFFDQDPGAGNGIPVLFDTPGPSIASTVSITVPQLALGQHLMYLRAQFDDGVWGLVDLDTIEVFPGVICFADMDSDGYGDLANSQVFVMGCPLEFVADSSDCDDTNAAINPGVAENCNGYDDNCNGLIDQAELVQVSPKVFLQGPYVSAIQLMHDSLRVKNLIPLTEPYSVLTNFTHVGGGGELTTQTALAVTGSNAIVDWVFLELRSNANPAQVLATRAALLQRDGDVVDVNGVSPVRFPAPGDTAYFLAVRHRNHLGVQPDSAVIHPFCTVVETAFTALPPGDSYTFNGLNPAQRLISGKYVLWAGNGRVDFQLKYNGSNNDRSAILSVVGLSTPNATVPGYILADYNLDGVVKYNGASNDRNLLLGNVGIATPSAIIHDQTAR
jgi:hypothetical protein